jgi:sirohydrochlorin cobaltochelatase
MGVAVPMLSGPTGRCGVLVVGHGTADPVGAEETKAVADITAAMIPTIPLELGFLEVIGPSIGEAIERLAARGCRSVVVAPLLVFAAGHARRDVPEAVMAAAAAAGITVLQTAPLGCHPEIVALSRRRRAEALDRLAPVPPSETVLVLVGRGSSDPSALSQLQEFASRSIGPPDEPSPSRVAFGFVAAARPSLDEALATAVHPSPDHPTGVRRVIVQPHLLFRGHVEGEVAAAVERFRRENPQVEWLQVARLGADEAVGRALVARVVEATCGSLESDSVEILSRQGRPQASQ